MRRLATILVAIMTLIATPAMAGTTYTHTFTKDTYSGSRDRQYSVYVPSNVLNPAPMVMVLHGCVQNQNDALNEWGMKAKADSAGYILVTPFITTYDGMRSENCWGFWFDQHAHEGQGEPEDLHQIALEVESNYSIDPNKRYITGLSSGGAMTVIAAVTHNEYWTAAASASGLAYGETSSSVALGGMAPTFESVNTTVGDMSRELDSDYPIPLMILQNNADHVVQQPAGYNIRDSFLKKFGPTGYQTPNSTKASEAACASYFTTNYNCKHVKYTTDGTINGRSIVETIFYDGPDNGMKGHYWIGGTEANYAKATGPDYPTLVWTFFNAQSRSGQPSNSAGAPHITITGDNPAYVEEFTSYADAGATATDPEDGTLTVNSNCNVNTSVVGDYQCVYTATDSSGTTATSVRVVKVYTDTPPAASCAEQTASPSAHIAAGRAVKGGDYGLYAMIGTTKIGYSFDTWSSVTLYEGNSGEWFTQQPAVCHGGETPPSSGGFTCQDWYATNMSHQSAGRAVYQSMWYKAAGSLQNLGQMSGTYSWVKETSSGYYEAGQCQ